LRIELATHLHVLRFQVINQTDQVAQRVAQLIELLDNKCITLASALRHFANSERWMYASVALSVKTHKPHFAAPHKF